MFPGSGLLASVLSLSALYSLWLTPLPGLWWVILGITVVSLLFTSTLKEASRQAGGKVDSIVKFWVILCLLVELVLMGTSAYALWWWEGRTQYAKVEGVHLTLELDNPQDVNEYSVFIKALSSVAQCNATAGEHVAQVLATAPDYIPKASRIKGWRCSATAHGR
ncbi:MAG: hypothetical protein RIS36_2147 [Pseudomonadota bacterium]|jgi:hypothetical protein